MPNPYFNFKQFSIAQGRSAMKVTTDGAVFGAVLAQQPAVLQAKSILDVGTGTGLLSLMVAQQNQSATFNALEIDPGAAADAIQNFSTSVWHQRLRVFECDAMLWPASTPYDVLISNPPFFENGLRSPSAARNAALHNTSFQLAAFPDLLARHLLPTGHCYVLLPAPIEATFVALLCEAGWENSFCLRLHQTDAHRAFRSILGFCKKNASEAVPQTLVIKRQNDYTPEVLPYLSPYYLYLSPIFTAMNYFELFGIAPVLQLDTNTLKSKFFELQRQYHPDYAAPDDDDAAAKALEMTALMNAAWKTFGNKDTLIKYVLELRGVMPADEKYNLPPDFLMTVMELNEQKMDGGDGAELDKQVRALQQEIYEKVQPLLHRYHHQTTSDTDLEQVKQYYYQKKYLDRLAAE